jgi:hypothetical protein
MANRKQIDAFQGKHPYTVQTGTSIPFFGQQQLGLDGKIYIQIAAMDYWPLAADWPQWRSAIARIPRPDLPWPQCGYESHAIRGYDTTNATASLPNLPNYGLGPLVGSGCDTLPPAAWHPNPADTALWHPNPADTLPMAWAFAVPEAATQNANPLSCRPNPANTQLLVQVPPGQGSLHWLDELGRQWQTTEKPAGITEVELNTAGLPPGIYRLRFSGAAGALLQTPVCVFH